MAEVKSASAAAQATAQAQGTSRQESAAANGAPQQGQGQRRPGLALNFSVLKRVLKDVHSFYPVLLPVAVVCILINAVVNAIPPIFMQQALAMVEANWQTGDWEAIATPLFKLVATLATFYVICVICNFVWNRLMAIICQGSLMKFREKLFNHMQTLPIRYFDTHKYGDIMSHYTNDIDALRQMLSQSLPQMLLAGCVCLGAFFIMLWYSVWMCLVVIVGMVLILVTSKKLAGNSARFFIAQQKTVGAVEGHIEEIMNGERVVQVFNHEREVEAEFDKINQDLFEKSFRAFAYSNVLAPILMNMGNVIYVAVAVAAGIFLYLGTPNLSLSGCALSISVAIPFLNMCKQFTGQIGQVSQQINAVVMGMAGAERIYALVDEAAEKDDGYVTLVNACEGEDGTLTECDARTGVWAWRHPHKDGTVTFERLAGDVRFEHVDFGYNPDNLVLHDVSLFAKPGQKVAFVGATGAGKTTITNLINRFYDLADGKIRYDGINISKIKKDDLRTSLGMVLQDVNLFSGTVLENIRYGRLDATDDECIAAAKLAGADTFIERLPHGYNTYLSDNGAQLSQGQRQLVSIARAAVADPPVMILDEATSSIDTRTEAIVQRGMDALMQGRTTFVIAHRLSTVRNANVIIVLDHGHIIERGTHDELIAAKGVYYQLYTGAFELE
jgi:ATP-binding cassette subfamily B protein